MIIDQHTLYHVISSDATVQLLSNTVYSALSFGVDQRIQFELVRRPIPGLTSAPSASSRRISAKPDAARLLPEAEPERLPSEFVRELPREWALSWARTLAVKTLSAAYWKVREPADDTGAGGTGGGTSKPHVRGDAAGAADVEAKLDAVADAEREEGPPALFCADWAAADMAASAPGRYFDARDERAPYAPCMAPDAGSWSVGGCAPTAAGYCTPAAWDNCDDWSCVNCCQSSHGVYVRQEPCGSSPITTLHPHALPRRPDHGDQQ